MRKLNGKEVSSLKKAQADLAQAKRGLAGAIAELDGLIPQWQGSGDIEAMEAGMETRIELRNCLSDIETAHLRAGQRLRDIFEDGGDIVVQGGGGR